MKHILLVFVCLLSITVKSQIITTVAGGATGHGGYWGDGGPATAAETGFFGGITTDNLGNVYISDGSNHRIRKINVYTGLITTSVGTGIGGFNGDGILGTSSQLFYPGWISIGYDNSLYIADSYNNRMRKLDLHSDTITTLAGTGIMGSSGDGGLAVHAEINGGGGGVIDRFGNIYLLEVRKIRKISPSGYISTIAGNGFSGVTFDSVQATSTCVIPQGGIGVDYLGNVYFSDSTRSIRKIDIATGVIYRIAGTGNYISSPYSGDGLLAKSCRIGPMGIDVDDSGNVYIADMTNSRIEKVDVTTGRIYTIAGNGLVGFSGDGGLATNSTLSNPQGVSVDLCGNVYIADFGNKRVRKVTMPPTLTIPTISLSVTGTAIPTPVGSTVTVNATVANAGSSYMIRWQNRGVEFATTTVPVVTYTKMPGVDTITARVVSTASYGCYDSTTSAPQYVSDSSTSVRGVGVMGGVYVYPNPAKKQVTIMAGERMRSVAISNMQGQELLRYAPDATSYTVAIDMLPPGVYVIRVNDVWVGKVVKE